MYRLSSFGLSSFVLRKFFFFLSSSVCLTVHVLFCFVVFLSVFLSPSTTPVHVGFAPMHLSFMSLVLSFSVCPPLTFSVLSFCLIFTHPVQSSVISYWPVLLLFCPLPNSSVTKEIMMEFFQDFRPFLLLCLLASVGPFFSLMSSQDLLSFLPYCLLLIYPVILFPVLFYSSLSLLRLPLFCLLAPDIPPSVLLSFVSSYPDVSPSILACLVLFHLFLSCPHLFSAALLCFVFSDSSEETPKQQDPSTLDMHLVY